MLYTTITVGEQEYKLRLGARQTVELEKALGANPLNVLMEMSNGGLPRLEPMVLILHSALQKYNHGISIDKTYDLLDDYYDNGGSLVSLIPIVTEIFKVSGFFTEEEMAQAEAQGEISPN